MTDFKENLSEEPYGFLNIAHRGASAYVAENTVAAIEKAIDCGADMVEFDLRQTKDGVIVLFHDPAITLPSRKTVPVSKVTFSELSEFGKAEGFVPATFEEVLHGFGGRIAFDIEIKVGGFEKEVVKLLRSNPPVYEPVISSFKPEILWRIKRLESSVKVGIIIGSGKIKSLSFIARPFVERILARTSYDTVHLHRSLASHSVLESLLDSGFPVYVWTVNDPVEIREFVEQGVTGIISDVPDVVYGTCVALADSKDPVLHREGGNAYRFAFPMGRLGVR